MKKKSKSNDKTAKPNELASTQDNPAVTATTCNSAEETPVSNSSMIARLFDAQDPYQTGYQWAQSDSLDFSDIPKVCRAHKNQGQLSFKEFQQCLSSLVSGALHLRTDVGQEVATQVIVVAIEETISLIADEFVLRPDACKSDAGLPSRINKMNRRLAFVVCQQQGLLAFARNSFDEAVDWFERSLTYTPMISGDTYQIIDSSMWANIAHVEVFFNSDIEEQI